ncbi:CRISPR-associated Cas3 family helicase [Hydrogenispora ethanolica]|uniref:CRISPR-associated Cas3 family helicase n=1 Tax=Hydrogenispora ethanolica TaxID=1082276 RepID=A0A4R1QLT3_HYDET|nr:CRISPR-associated helicase Cas3' [Hydrogenispora ethanolica]TCL54669.1 CRISPR-associated Cas3 family helicase [Hydrogenispora ethanolica]
METRSMLYSHPDKFLTDHLYGVVQLGQYFFDEKKTRLLPTMDARTIIDIIGTAHDLGKATCFFQNYLTASEMEKLRLKKAERTHHGLFSAVCGYFLAKTMFTDGFTEEVYPLLCFLVIRRHHGNLSDIMTETILTATDYATFQEQLDGINPIQFDLLLNELQSHGLATGVSFERLKEWFRKIKTENLRLKAKQFRVKHDLKLYFLIDFFYSLLVDADKSEAAIGVETILKIKRYNLGADLVEHYKQVGGFINTPLNQLREQAYQEVLDQNYHNLQPGVYTINLPTGLGKTLAAFSFAFQLKKTLMDIRKVNYRIIYALPFMSIIDQNHQVMEKILQTNGIARDNNILLKHHYLTSKGYETDATEFEPEMAKIMVEGWYSEIIITTFVQLFQTLLTGRNRAVRKFHRFSNSIIILDEVQSVRYELWPLIREMLHFLTTHFECYVIFVTATDPLIFRRDEVVPLVKREKYFQVLNRLRVWVDLKAVSIKQLIKELKLDSGKSYLFILNTIGSAQNFFHMLQEQVTEEVLFLSSQITPKERLERIERIKSGAIRLAVTTQLVEAGVDIDFNIVYRDFAPFDSINQAAGRCNRNGLSPGEFYIIKLIDDQNKPYCRLIYSPAQLDITEALLRQTNEYREKDFLGLIDEYYELVHSKCSFDASANYLDAVYNLRYKQEDSCTELENGSLDIDSFQLIKSYPKVDAFIIVDDTAEMLWDQFLEINKVDNIFEKRSAFEKVKAEFYQYVISIPATVKNIPPEAGGFFFVPRLQLKEFYDQKTGFKAKGTKTIW